MRSRRDFHLEVRYLANFQCVPLCLTLQLLSVPLYLPSLPFLVSDLLEHQQASVLCWLCVLYLECLTYPGCCWRWELQFGPRVQLEQLAICSCKCPAVESWPVLMRWVRGETRGKSFRTCWCHLSSAGGSSSFRS